MKKELFTGSSRTPKLSVPKYILNAQSIENGYTVHIYAVCKLRIQTIRGLPVQTSDLRFVQPIRRLSTCLSTHYLTCHVQTLQRGEEHARVRSNGTPRSIQKWSKQTYLSANKVGSRIIHGLSCLKFGSKVCTGQSLDCPGNPRIGC